MGRLPPIPPSERFLPEIPAMSRSHRCLCWLCLALGLSLVLALLRDSTPRAQAQPTGKKGPVSFINDVAPILKENCFACHDAKKRKGKFDMTTYENFRKGGDHDDPVAAGKPEESHLIDVLNAKDGSRMPPPKDIPEQLPKEK